MSLFKTLFVNLTIVAKITKDMCMYVCIVPVCTHYMYICMLYTPIMYNFQKRNIEIASKIEIDT